MGNYKIDEKLIHDYKAMWELACMMILEYESLIKEIEDIKKYGYLMFNGEIIHKTLKPCEYEKHLAEYEFKLKYLNDILNGCAKDYKKIAEYITKDT